MQAGEVGIFSSGVRPLLGLLCFPKGPAGFLVPLLLLLGLFAVAFGEGHFAWSSHRG